MSDRKKTKLTLIIIFGAASILSIAGLIILFSGLTGYETVTAETFSLFRLDVILAYFTLFFVLMFISRIALPSHYYSQYSKKTVKRKNAVYAKYIPSMENIDYKKELEQVRKNFEADTDSEKNVIRRDWRFKRQGMPNLFEKRVIRAGKIVYGCLVQVNTTMFEKSRRLSLEGGVIVYSPDAHFEEHPEDLIAIAKNLFANKQNNILNNELHYFLDLKLKDIPENRSVFLTCLVFDRAHLPMAKLGYGRIFPIITDVDHISSTFVVDDKYWSERLITEFLYPTKM